MSFRDKSLARCGCPSRYVVLQGAYARYTNTLMVLERALWMAVATNRTLLVDVPAVFTPALKVAPNTRSLGDILQLERYHAACRSLWRCSVRRRGGVRCMRRGASRATRGGVAADRACTAAVARPYVLGWLEAAGCASATRGGVICVLCL